MILRSTALATWGIGLLLWGLSTLTFAELLVGNTEGNNVVVVDETTGAVLGDFIPAGSGGLSSPDDLTFGPDGNLYVSSGSDTTGSILRYDGQTGAFIDVFVPEGRMLRPYGNAFGPDGLFYVASFRTDEILRFDAMTGAFVDVFATGDGSADGLNGPNGLLFGPDGMLYVSTQGSVADGVGGVDFLFASQVLRYDIATAEGEVFVPEATPLEGSFDFVSFLGLAIGPDGNLYTTDFANGVRVYDFADGSLLQTIATAYVFDDNQPPTSTNFIGNLVFLPDGNFYLLGFNTANNNLGALLRFDAATGMALPAAGNPGAALVVDVPGLLRPIGIVAALPPAVAIPTLGKGAMLLLVLLLGGGAARLRRRHD